MFVVLVTTGFTDKFNVAMESHPAELIKLAVYVPAALIAWPFQVYGSWLSQIVVFVALVAVEFTVTVVVHEIVLHLLAAVHVIIETPRLNIPLALFPKPFLIVVPVIWKVVVIVPLQLSDSVGTGIV